MSKLKRLLGTTLIVAMGALSLAPVAFSTVRPSCNNGETLVAAISAERTNGTNNGLPRAPQYPNALYWVSETGQVTECFNADPVGNAPFSGSKVIDASITDGQAGGYVLYDNATVGQVNGGGASGGFKNTPAGLGYTNQELFWSVVFFGYPKRIETLYVYDGSPALVYVQGFCLLYQDFGSQNQDETRCYVDS